MKQLLFWEKDGTKMVGVRSGMEIKTMKWLDLNDAIRELLVKISSGCEITSEPIPESWLE